MAKRRKHVATNRNIKGNISARNRSLFLGLNGNWQKIGMLKAGEAGNGDLAAWHRDCEVKAESLDFVCPA